MAGPRVTVWFDFICPFCYVGLERAAWLERRFGAEIEWRPFDLHPEYPPEGIPRAALERRYGPAAIEGVRRMVEDAGLPHAAEIARVPNGRRALVLAQLARERGALARLVGPVFRAYWAEARDIGSPDVLATLAGEAGLDPAEAREAMAAERGLDAVRRSTEEAIELGAGGVPAWLVDGRLLVPGAQPHDVFARVLDRLGHEPLPGAAAA